MCRKGAHEHVAAAVVKEIVATEGLTWGMKASTPHRSSVDTTTATALTIFVEAGGWAWGGEKTVALPVCVCVEGKEVMRTVWCVVVSKQCDGSKHTHEVARLLPSKNNTHADACGRRRRPARASLDSLSCLGLLAKTFGR